MFAISFNLLAIYWGLSASGFFSVWFMLELNMLTFMGVLIYLNSNYTLIAIPLYFIPQAISSAILFLGLCCNFLEESKLFSVMVIQLALVLKLGLAPLHMWLIRLSFQISEQGMFFLSITQKILPLFIFTVFTEKLSILFIFITIFISTASAVHQTQALPLLAFSSMFTASWVLISTNFYLGMSYFLLYAVGLAALLYYSYHWKIKFLDQTHSLPLPTLLGLAATGFMLMGMPPLVSFLPKISIVQEMVSLMNAPGAFLAVLASFVFFYVYLKFILIALNSTKCLVAPVSSELHWMSFSPLMWMIPWLLI